MQVAGQLVTKLIFLIAASLVCGSAAARAENSQDCIDALVSAKIVRQIPSPFPDCGDDCIIMSWPWFVDMKIKRVLRGRAPTGKVTVLAVLHTSYRKDLPSREWALRRNDLGGFNLIRTSDARPLPLCPENAPPASPYIRPKDGESLADVIRDSQRDIDDDN